MSGDEAAVSPPAGAGRRPEAAGLEELGPSRASAPCLEVSRLQPFSHPGRWALPGARPRVGTGPDGAPAPAAPPVGPVPLRLRAEAGLRQGAPRRGELVSAAPRTGPGPGRAAGSPVHRAPPPALLPICGVPWLYRRVQRQPISQGNSALV